MSRHRIYLKTSCYPFYLSVVSLVGVVPLFVVYPMFYCELIGFAKLGVKMTTLILVFSSNLHYKEPGDFLTLSGLVLCLTKLLTLENGGLSC